MDFSSLCAFAHAKSALCAALLASAAAAAITSVADYVGRMKR